jgi:MFS family permease
VTAAAGGAEALAARTPRRAWVVWGLAALAYVVAVFHRGSFGVAAVAAQERFGATAAVLSLFVVLQLGVYASLQVPVGVLLDRIGSRRLVAAGAVVMAGGQILLATTTSIGLAVLARVLIGAGDAMTFISVLRLVTLWFAPGQAPVMSQITGLVGQLGQLTAAFPLVALLAAAGWTESFLLAGFAGLAVAVLAFAFVRDLPPGARPLAPPESLAAVRAHLLHAWREPGTRLGFWTHFGTQFSATVFALIWGYPFLVVGEGRTPQEAGLLIGLLVVVSIVVGPVLGKLAGRWPYRRSVPTLTIISTTAAAWAIVLAWPGPAPLVLLVALVVVMATNGPGSVVGFDYARTENPPERLGSATGIVNVGGFVAALSTILLIGLVLDALAPGGPESYTLGDFRAAMAVQFLPWTLGFAGVLRSRRRLRAHRGIELDTFPQALARVTRERRERRR